VRGYTTTEDGGNSYDMLFTGININRVWKDDKPGLSYAAATYAGATLNGSTPENAHSSESRYRYYCLVVLDLNRLLIK
jgi:hypothetical protein